MRVRTVVVPAVVLGAAALSGCTATEPRPTDSPDPMASAERIAYTYEQPPRSGRLALWTVNADGNDPQPVGDQLGQFPDWSPDRAHLLFDFFDEDGAVHVGRIAPDGTGFAQLTDDVFSGEPDYSPDGSTIVLSKSPVADEDAPGFTQTLWLMNADGTDPRPLLEPADAGFDYEGEFSPDGAEIVFTRIDPATGHSALFIVAADGTGIRQLTPFDDFVEHPRWSPDGATIVYNVQHSADLGDPRNGIWTVPSSGGDPSILLATTSEMHPIKPDYSPDGERIAFGCKYLESDNEELCVMDADGTDVTRLTQTPGNENNIVWD
ncbi:hypothetical protein GCM10009775_29550 [Microbacterium aoyamense]|uniref:Uncharacterized protein n=1 Tax=Microbacterium aoyamense TaxID=344166 RepID=A0ABN2PX82_9MICO|nr:hypothetical protein [Microbacterium aoyamense]